ncbi:MAG: CapA family protein [Myxococcota bacterium]
MLAPLAEHLDGALGIVNLEGPVGRGAEASTAARLVNDARALPYLVEHGVAVAGIANNHSGDLGPDGPDKTAAALAAIGIQAAGDGRVAVLERDSLRVAVTAHDLSSGVPDGLADELARAAASADVLVVGFHVLAPPLYAPRPELRRAVDIALGAGARVIFAHGSHVAARVERRERAIIAWGLGNLVFDCRCTDEREGLIVRVDLSRDTIDRALVIPIDAGLAGQPAQLTDDPGLMFDVLESLRSSPLSRAGDRAFF